MTEQDLGRDEGRAEGREREGVRKMYTREGKEKGNEGKRKRCSERERRKERI